MDDGRLCNVCYALPDRHPAADGQVSSLSLTPPYPLPKLALLVHTPACTLKSN
jgi:hypothetical protein